MKPSRHINVFLPKHLKLFYVHTIQKGGHDQKIIELALQGYLDTKEEVQPEDEQAAGQFYIQYYETKRGTGATQSIKHPVNKRFANLFKGLLQQQFNYYLKTFVDCHVFMKMDPCEAMRVFLGMNQISEEDYSIENCKRQYYRLVAKSNKRKDLLNEL